jgi:hypothetical protein
MRHSSSLMPRASRPGPCVHVPLETKLGLQLTEKRFRTLDEILAKVRDGEVHIVNAVTHPYISVPNIITVRKDSAKRMNEKDLAQSYAVTEYLLGQDVDFMMTPVPDDLTALLNVFFGLRCGCHRSGHGILSHHP